MSKSQTVVALSSFAKEVVARIAGDGNEALAQKISRKASSAIKGQLASLEAKLVDAEANLDDAIEDYATAKFPTKMITNNTNYCQQVIDAQYLVDERTEDVEDIKNSLKMFSDLSKGF